MSAARHAQTKRGKAEGGAGGGGRTSRRRVWLGVSLSFLALVVVAGGLLYVAHQRNNTAAASPPPPPPTLTVTSITPSGTAVSGGSTISVSFSTALAPDSPMPTLTPAVPGAWSVLSASVLQYQATGPLIPGVTETITVPGGAGGVLGSRGQHLAATDTSTFTAAQGSTLRLQELLAELGYLPVNFNPAGPVTSATQEADDQVGTFTWRWANQPASLTSLWTPGTWNVITKGAVMNFESQHNITVDGIPGPAVWTALLTAVEQGQGNALPWGYVFVTENLPETATVYQNGVETYSTLANTGVAGATTQTGTFTVYARYLTTTMTGTDPDGTHYVDPGIPWVSYFNGGDALHGYPRASYGFPQSNGCVEMPIANAAIVFPQTPLGTLVTVSA